MPPASGRGYTGQAMTTDPQDELFDLCDPEGRPTRGRATRAEAHRHGLWHRALHCWVVTRDDDGRALLLVQQRSRTKDTWPGAWDCSVGGHYRPGEGLREAVVRELAEELGVTARAEELVGIAPWRHDPGPDARGWDREWQERFLLRRDLPLATLRPLPDEVAAVAHVVAEDLIALAAGVRAEAPAQVWDPHRREVRAFRLAATSLVPRPLAYYEPVVGAALRLLDEPSERSPS